MRILNNLSIKRRLTFIIMTISSVSILLTTLSISIIGVVNLRANIITELDLSASLVGDRNNAALSFGFKDQAETNLSIFAAKKEIIQSCLYDKDGAIFARYESKELPKGDCPNDLTKRVTVSDDHIEVMKPIFKGDLIGHIYVESTQEQVRNYIERQTVVALTIALAGLVFSYLLAINLQRSISKPILNLSDTARKVSAHKNYSIRAEKFGDIKSESNNELVILTDSFNEMLSEIDARNVQLRKQYAELERAKDAAESANRAKSQFLANISHELRTPLNAVIGFSSILMNQLFGPLGDQKYLEYAKDINESGVHLLDIINDILDLSKAEAGKLTLNYEEIYVAKAINKCVTIITDRAQKGKISISTDVPKMLPPLIVDRLRFVQVVINILSNAVKFTEEGGKVNISVRTKEVGLEVSEFLVVVSDTGIGMTKEDIEQSFQSFGQVDSGLNRKYEGTGLGLPLTKKLMEIHGGSIHIESELGKGTTVTLAFPAVPPGDIDLEQFD